MLRTLEALNEVPTDRPLFEDRGALISAGQIRSTADFLKSRIGHTAGPIHLFTSSAALFAAGLLASAQLARAVLCHPSLQLAAQVGSTDGVLLTDDPDIDRENCVRMTLARESSGTAIDKNVRALDIGFYTSGATGEPKCVWKSITNLEQEVVILNDLWGAGAGRTVATVSHQHIYGLLFRVIWPLMSGRISSDQAAKFWEHVFLQLTPDAMLVSSPAHLSRLPRDFVEPGPKLVFSSGALLSFEDSDACRRMFGHAPYEILGSTETGGIAWRVQNTREAAWKPLPSVQVGCPDGLLEVASPFTGQVQAVRTNDRAELVGDGFRLLGRADRIVKVEGSRVSLPRVESALVALPLVSDAVVVDIARNKQSLGAIVELTPAGEARLKEVGAFRLSRQMRVMLRQALSPPERPKVWRFGSIPVNSQGKRVQSAIREMLELPLESKFGRGRILLQDTDNSEIELELLPELDWFSGHFPGAPVLPGIAQVHIALAWGEHVWKWRPEGVSITLLKFRRLLRPSMTVRLRLARSTDKGRLKFSYHLDQVVASEGQVGGQGA